MIPVQKVLSGTKKRKRKRRDFTDIVLTERVGFGFLHRHRSSSGLCNLPVLYAARPSIGTTTCRLVSFIDHLLHVILMCMVLLEFKVYTKGPNMLFSKIERQEVAIVSVIIIFLALLSL